MYVQCMYNLGSTKIKQVSDRLECTKPILHQHIYGQYTTATCPKCAYKILQIFSRVFEFALAEYARNAKPDIPRRYFHFYIVYCPCTKPCDFIVR